MYNGTPIIVHKINSSLRTSSCIQNKILCLNLVCTFERKHLNWWLCKDSLIQKCRFWAGLSCTGLIQAWPDVFLVQMPIKIGNSNLHVSHWLALEIETVLIFLFFMDMHEIWSHSRLPRKDKTCLIVSKRTDWWDWIGRVRDISLSLRSWGGDEEKIKEQHRCFQILTKLFQKTVNREWSLGTCLVQFGS